MTPLLHTAIVIGKHRYSVVEKDGDDALLQDERGTCRWHRFDGSRVAVMNFTVAPYSGQVVRLGEWQEWLGVEEFLRRQLRGAVHFLRHPDRLRHDNAGWSVPTGTGWRNVGLEEALESGARAEDASQGACNAEQSN